MSDFVEPPDKFELRPSEIRDIRPDVLDHNGRFQILPASYWATTTADERALFGHYTGIYSFPTAQLVDYLRGLIGDRKAIEVGAGNGVLAEALGITATDSYQQIDPKYRAHYESIKQPIVPYGDNVLAFEASEAVRKFKPEVVIGCWVTHKYDPKRHKAGGNEAGIKEEYILDRGATYIHISNEKVHRGKAIWTREHEKVFPTWLYSRARNDTRDFIAIWPSQRSLREAEIQGKSWLDLPTNP